MENYPLKISEDDIGRLDSVRLVALMNEMLRLEGRLLGVDQTDIETTLTKTTVRDGGVDARVRNAPLGSDCLPAGLSVWQSKSGNKNSVAVLEDAFIQPKVQKVLQDGGTFVLWIGADIEPGKGQDERRAAMDECCKKMGIPVSRCKIFYAGQIKEWANRFPTVVLHFKGDALGDLLLWSDWSKLKRYHEAFVPDTLRAETIKRFEEELGASSSEFRFLRIEGQTGVGKSKLALEIFRDSYLSSLVLYAPTPDCIPSRFWTYLRTNLTQIILVVDECSIEGHQQFTANAELCLGHVRLLTIGQAYHPASVAQPHTTVVLLKRLDDTSMRKLLSNLYPLLPSEVLDFIIHSSSGFVKIAVVLGMKFAESSAHFSLFELIQSREVCPLLEAMLPDKDDRRAMEVVALLRRVGWHGELDVEAQCICDFLDLKFRDVQFRIQSVEDTLGLVGREQRFRYVTPVLLGVWLAADVWRRLGPDEVWKLRGLLPNPLGKLAFEDRVKDIISVDEFQNFAQALLGPNGLFRKLDDLYDRANSRFFHLVATASPKAGMRALRRLIDGASRDQLLAFVEGRTEVIWTLQALAWRREFFDEALRLLMELAVMEDRTIRPIGPHASEEWLGFFRVSLGGTEAPMSQRLEQVRRALVDQSESKHLLAVKIICVVFSTEESRVDQDILIGGKPHPREWRPRDNQEALDVFAQTFTLLDEMLFEHGAKIRDAALAQLLDASRVLGYHGFATELLDRLEKLLPIDEKDRFEMRAAIDEILEFSISQLTDGQLMRARKFRDDLAGNSFSDRLKRLFGKRTLGDEVDYNLGFEEGNRIKRQQAMELVNEAITAPELLNVEWDWLFSREAQNVYSFAWALGALDENLIWWDFVQEEAARRERSLVFSTAYFEGQVENGRLSRDQVLRDWTDIGKNMAPAVFDVIWRGKVTDEDLRRVTEFVNQDRIAIEAVGSLYYGGSTLQVRADTFHIFVVALLEKSEQAGLDLAVSFLHQRIKERPSERDIWESLAWAAVEREGGFRRRNRDSMLRYYADQLASMLALYDPVRASSLVLRLFDDDEELVMIGSESSMDVLRAAVAVDPKSVWSHVAARLLSSVDTTAQDNLLRSYSLRMALDKWFTSLIPADILLEWASDHIPFGPLLLAKMTPVFGETLNDLPRGLLTSFGNEQVAAALKMQFLTGTWWGSEAEHLRCKSELVRKWEHDANRAVSRWAASLQDTLELGIIEARQREEEFGF